MNFKEKHPDFAGTIIDSSWSTLNESGEEIALKDSTGNILESFSYIQINNTSLQRKDLNSDEYTETNWAEHLISDSAGRVNEFVTTTIDEEVLEEVVVEEMDVIPEDEIVTEETEVVTEENEDIGVTQESDTVNETTSNNSSASGSSISTPPPAPKQTVKIIINEIFPNPYGPDLPYEFIELKNISDSVINLEGYKITTSRTSYSLTPYYLQPNSLLVIERKDSNISLANTKDTVSLYDKNGKLIYQTKYNHQFKDNESLQYINKKWEVTGRPTKNEENQYTPPDFEPVLVVDCKKINNNSVLACDASDSYDQGGENILYEWKLQIQEKTINLYESYIEIPVENISDITLTITDGKNYTSKDITKSSQKPDEDESVTEELPKGYEKVVGTVVTLPGLISKDEFAINQEDYIVKIGTGTIPQIKIGDTVEIIGHISEGDYGKKISINKKGSLQVIGQENIEPSEIEFNELDQYANQFVRINAVIKRKTAYSIEAEDETGNGTIKIKKSSLIKTKELALDQVLEVIGIVLTDKTGSYLVPRSPDDLRSETLAISDLAPPVSKKVENVVASKTEKSSQLPTKTVATVAAGIGLLGVALKIKTLFA